MNCKKVLFVGAHPDDIELSCSGFIKRLIDEGVEVVCLICSSGGLGGNISERVEEQKNSAIKMGVKFYNFSWEDGYIAMNGETVGMVEKFIMFNKFDLVVTHYFEDTHQDHTTVAKIVKSVCYRKNISLMYFDSSSSTNFAPNFYISIDLKYKESVIKLFRSQVNRSNILEKARVKAMYNGIQSGNDFAEAYRVERLLW